MKLLDNDTIEIAGEDTSTNQVDLSTIDIKYHPIFTTDWNEGSNSTMDINARLLIHKLYLDYIRNKQVFIENEYFNYD